MLRTVILRLLCPIALYHMDSYKLLISKESSYAQKELERIRDRLKWCHFAVIRQTTGCFLFAFNQNDFCEHLVENNCVIFMRISLQTPISHIILFRRNTDLYMTTVSHRKELSGTVRSSRVLLSMHSSTGITNTSDLKSYTLRFLLHQFLISS